MSTTTNRGTTDESTCTPGSVAHQRWAGGHPSRPAVTGRLQRSTRRHRAGHPRSPAQAVTEVTALLTLLRVGFTEPSRSPGMLVVSYTTVAPLPGRSRSRAVCSLWHFPAGRPGLPLATTL